MATTKKEAVAKHYLLDAQGSRLDGENDIEENAHGIEYNQLSTGKSVKAMVADFSTDALRQLACFALKTLATNEASQVRNNPKGAGSDSEQLAAIEDRFATIKSGQWADRTRDGVGARVDKPMLATAWCNVAVRDGTITEEQKPDYYAKVAQKLEEDKQFQAMVRNTAGVPEEYAVLMGRQTKTTSDLLAAIG